MNEESKLIELFKKYPGIAARIRRSFAYHYDQILRYQIRRRLHESLNRHTSNL